MAITKTTISKSAGWARTDVVYQLEEAFTWLGWHGDTLSGIVTGFTRSGGGSGSAMAGSYYEDVFPVTTSGIGTGASFYIYRGSGGSISQIFVNRPGVGYTNGEYVTLSTEDIGGSANGATGIGITVFVSGGASPVGYGTTTAFFDKDVTAGSSSPWGVLRHTIEPNKKFGDTYRGFLVNSLTNIGLHCGSSFHPEDSNPFTSGTNYIGNRFAGSYQVDTVGAIDNANTSYNYPNNISQTTSSTYASSNSYQLDLNIFRSGIDPNFAVISFRHPTLSSTHLTGNTYATFILHNFTNSLFDLDHLFLGGITEIISTSGNTNFPQIIFRTYTAGLKRMAEDGYINDGTSTYKDTVYMPNSFNRSGGQEYFGMYLRNSTRNQGIYSSVSSSTEYNAVIKGLPLNALFIPSPYYIPDDFVLIDFDYPTPSANIQQGDTVTISGSEVYTVITGSYNQTTRTRGILFCARIV